MGAGEEGFQQLGWGRRKSSNVGPKSKTQPERGKLRAEEAEGKGVENELEQLCGTCTDGCVTGWTDHVHRTRQCSAMAVPLPHQAGHLRR